MVVDPTSLEEIKKLTSDEPTIGINCILKSVANILVNLLRPTHEPGWKGVWSYIERIFSMISSSLDHTHEVSFIIDFLIFMKQFVKAFLARYRNERKMYEAINEDHVEDYHGEADSSSFVITEEYLKLMEDLWIPIIP